MRSKSSSDIDHILSKLKLSSDEWESLQKDFIEKETKAIICAKYNLKGHQYKALKKFYLGDSNV